MEKRPSRYIPPALRWAIWERDDFTCQHCGVRRYLTIDHVLPFSRGGDSGEGNLHTLCQRCNSKKGARVEWGARRTKRYIRHVEPQPRRRAEPAWPVSRSYVYTGPDTFIPRFICATCGFPNTYEGDECSCRKPKETSEPIGYRCPECDAESHAEGALCPSCLYYCYACDAELPESDIDTAERQLCGVCVLAESVA